LQRAVEAAETAETTCFCHDSENDQSHVVRLYYGIRI
jgi:hypothetical protein